MIYQITAQDFRLMGSGLQTGFNEIVLPAVQAVLFTNMDIRKLVKYAENRRAIPRSCKNCYGRIIDFYERYSETLPAKGSFVTIVNKSIRMQNDINKLKVIL